MRSTAYFYEEARAELDGPGPPWVGAMPHVVGAALVHGAALPPAARGHHGSTVITACDTYSAGDPAQALHLRPGQVVGQLSSSGEKKCVAVDAKCMDAKCTEWGRCRSRRTRPAARPTQRG